MSEMSMIERVAGAMEAKRRDLINQPLSRVWEELAKSAMGAMREPTDQMFCNGDERILDFLNDHTFSLRETTPAVECWKSMIDAALK